MRTLSGTNGGRRQILARWLDRAGIRSALQHLPAPPRLLVLTYHRIGDRTITPFDPDVFSATSEEFDDQVAFLARHLHPVTLDEAVDFIENRRSWTGCRVLITFDDGYRDNYESAFPVLTRYRVPAVFFLATACIGTPGIGWWDQIAFLLRHATVLQFTLRYPAEEHFDLRAGNRLDIVRRALRLYKRQDMNDPERFLEELESACGCGRSSIPACRLFMNWDEAREMAAGGMAIESHTHSHRVLAQLPASDQRHEMERSRQEITERIGVAPLAMSYPVGERTAFTAETQHLAASAGYRVAFSMYGGVNRGGRVEPTDVLREDVDAPALPHFRTQLAVASAAGRCWP